MTTITLTDSAANKVRRLREEEGDNNLMLRVYVTGGGCSGFSYGFNFADEVGEDDASEFGVQWQAGNLGGKGGFGGVNLGGSGLNGTSTSTSTTESSLIRSARFSRSSSSSVKPV